MCVHARAYACTQCPRAHPHASLPLSALTISDVPRMELARGAVETRSRVVFIRAGRAVKADDPGVAREDRGDCSELQRYDEPPGAPVVSSPGAAGRGPAGVRATASAAPHAPSASHFPPAPVCARGELHRERARAQARALWTHGHVTGTWRVIRRLPLGYPSEFEVLMQRDFAALTSCCNRSTVAPVFFFGPSFFGGLPLRWRRRGRDGRQMPAGARTRQIRLPPVCLVELEQPSAQAAARPSRLWTTRAAAQGFFHDNGVRGMLHDFASELALFRPEDPRKFLYAKLQRELAAEEKAKEDNEERAPALDGQTDCLRVHTECRAGGRVRRGYFVQRAPLLSDPRLEAGGITPAASTRFVSWGAEALAAVKSVVHETAGLQAAGPESAGSTSDAAAASVSEGAQAQLDEAGTDGGAEGDRALTEDNAALARENATLKARLAAAAISTASDGSARPKRPGHDGVGRIIVEDGVMRMGVDPDVEMFIRSLNLEREIASQFAGATLAGVVDMEPAQTASVLRQAMPAMQQTLERAQAKARRVQEAQAAGGAKFGGVLQAFLDGVTGIVGEPAADLEKGMREEHTGMADSETRFSTGNYGLTTCPKHEYELVESGGCGLAGKKVDGSEEERVVVTGTRGACKGGQEGEDLRVLRPLEYCGRCADDGRLAIAAGDEVVVG